MSSSTTTSLVLVTSTTTFEALAEEASVRYIRLIETHEDFIRQVFVFADVLAQAKALYQQKTNYVGKRGQRNPERIPDFMKVMAEDHLGCSVSKVQQYLQISQIDVSTRKLILDQADMHWTIASLKHVEAAKEPEKRAQRVRDEAERSRKAKSEKKSKKPNPTAPKASEPQNARTFATKLQGLVRKANHEGTPPNEAAACAHVVMNSLNPLAIVSVTPEEFARLGLNSQTTSKVFILVIE